jgi:hypothetical protein
MVHGRDGADTVHGAGCRKPFRLGYGVQLAEPTRRYNSRVDAGAGLDARLLPRVL